MWTNWSECKPPCGRGRTRSRSRKEYINDEDQAKGQYRKIVQEEECPPRLGEDCPISLLQNGFASPDDASYRFMDAISDIDGPFLQLQAFAAMTILLLIFIVQYLRFLTYMFTL
nr:unnamed protein product [Spirometra erinaceieuropaei]